MFSLFQNHPFKPLLHRRVSVKNFILFLILVVSVRTSIACSHNHVDALCMQTYYDYDMGKRTVPLWFQMCIVYVYLFYHFEYSIGYIEFMEFTKHTIFTLDIFGIRKLFLRIAGISIQCSSIEKDDMIHARNFLHLHVVSSENTKPTNYIRLLSLSCIYTSYIQANRGGVELA